MFIYVWDGRWLKSEEMTCIFNIVQTNMKNWLMHDG